MEEKTFLQSVDEAVEFEEVSLDTCVEYAEKILTQGIQNYLENTSATQAIHRARELRYVLSMLELSQREDLKKSLQKSIKIYLESKHTSSTVYLVTLYLKQILFQIEGKESLEKEDDDLEVQKLGAFSYGRVFDDPTVANTDIKIVDLSKYSESIERMKQIDKRFAEYMDSAPISITDKSIPKILNRVMYYPGLLSDGTSPQMNLPWKPIEKSDLTLSAYSEISNEDMKDFIALKGRGMNKIIQKEFNIDLSYYTLSEQFQFLSYIKTASFEHIINLQKVFQTIPHTQIMEVFSALEGVDASLVSVFTDAYKFCALHEFQAILAVYHRALIHVKTFDSVFDSRTNIQEKDTEQIRRTFQVRLLRRISASLKENLVKGLKGQDVSAWIFEQDKQLNRDVSKDVMKSLLDSGIDVDIEIIKGAKISVCNMRELSKEQLEIEKEQYYHVWAVSEKKPVFAKVLRDSFQKRLNDNERLQKSRLYVFSINDERVASVIVEDVEDNSKYVTAVYVNDGFRNGSFAKFFLNEVYTKEKRSSKLILQADPNSPSAQIAFNNGFIGTDFRYEIFSDGSNEEKIPVFTMEYDEKRDKTGTIEYVEVDNAVVGQTLEQIFSQRNQDSRSLTIVAYQKNKTLDTVQLGIRR